jgi:hypothetical protein
MQETKAIHPVLIKKEKPWISVWLRKQRSTESRSHDNKRLFFWSLTAALAGFLFGFDTVVISGAEKTIQELWSLGNFQHGLAIVQ